MAHFFFFLFLSSYEYCKWDDNSYPQLFQDFHRKLFIRDFKKNKNKSHSFFCHLLVSLLWLDVFREQEKSELDVEGGQMQGQKISVEISKSGRFAKHIVIVKGRNESLK